MPDREKVAKAIEYLNWYFTQDDGAADKNAVEAWEVLTREQEPVKPRWTHPTVDMVVMMCGSCGIEIPSGKPNYCPWCGRKVQLDAE